MPIGKFWKHKCRHCGDKDKRFAYSDDLTTREVDPCKECGAKMEPDLDPPTNRSIFNITRWTMTRGNALGQMLRDRAAEHDESKDVVDRSIARENGEE